MRTAFINELCRQADNNEKIWLLCGDLGYGVLDQFATKFPNRFINVGVAEQNMMGIAAGLAMEGKTVFVYSIANFPTFRCLEQIRNDICYHNLNVKIVSVGGGLVYASHGYTHHGVEDIGVMRLLPNMNIFVPGDPVEALLATHDMINAAGPGYLRLAKSGEAKIHGNSGSIDIKNPILVKKGTEILILSCGGVLSIVNEAAKQLSSKGIDCCIVSIPCLKPIDESYIVSLIKNFRHVISVEDHGLGGLFTIMSEIYMKNRLSSNLTPILLKDNPIKFAGTQETLSALSGISVDQISNAALQLLNI